MRRAIPTVTTGTRFEEAFRIMQECNCPAVPVLDSMKRLVGLLTPENVSELMMVQSALPRRRAAKNLLFFVGRALCLPFDLMATSPRRPLALQFSKRDCR